MLHLILGRAGSGKTAKLLEILEETVRAGSPAILLVPDQFSFESERELYRRLGPQLSARVEVLGFSRLCNHIFRRYGGLSNKPVDDTARYLFMSIAVSESADQLSLYRDQADHISFIESMVDTIGELKTANNELQKDIEEKIRVDETRKEFIANVSHELKTPIALIQGYAEGLTEGMAEDPASRDYYCEVIMDEAGKMNRMVKQLLTLTALEFGNDKPVMEQFDIVGLIQGLLSSANILIQQKEAHVVFEAAAPVYVWADEFKIEEVVTNYLNNALNHLAGERLIRVRVDKGDREVRVSVYNTGEHIPEEDLDKLWVKFYKVDKARTREYGGSGIGLSIVKAIMDSHHKACGVANVEGGVEFWFTLDCGL